MYLGQNCTLYKTKTVQILYSKKLQKPYVRVPQRYPSILKKQSGKIK